MFLQPPVLKTQAGQDRGGEIWPAGFGQWVNTERANGVTRTLQIIHLRT